MDLAGPVPRIVETRDAALTGSVPAEADAKVAVDEASLELTLSGRTAFVWGDNSHRTAGKKDKPL
jgi:hypothetical protein